MRHTDLEWFFPKNTNNLQYLTKLLRQNIKSFFQPKNRSDTQINVNSKVLAFTK